MKMSKKKFRIGELADKLGVERFVIRFWEKEFGVRSQRSEGGQRFYDDDDYALFSKIKELLYNQGFTINGAKKQLESNVKIAAPKEKKIETHAPARKTVWDAEIVDQMGSLKKQLKKLSELL